MAALPCPSLTRADPQLAPAPTRAPAPSRMPHWLSTAHVPARGPSSVEAAPSPVRPSPAQPRRGAAECEVLVPAAAVPRGGAGGAAPRRGSAVWHRLRSGMLPKPVTPAPLSSLPPRRAGQDTGRPPGRQGWGWDLWSCYSSFLGAGQEGKPRRTLTRVVWDQPLQTLANIAGLSCGTSRAVL